MSGTPVSNVLAILTHLFSLKKTIVKIAYYKLSLAILKKLAMRCFHCHKKLTAEEVKVNINVLARNNSSSTHGLVFHTSCFKEIAGKEYTPGVELKELNWDNSVVYELGNYPDTGLFQKGDDLVIAAGGEPKIVIEGNAEIQGKLNLDCIDIDELKKKLGL